LPCSHLPDNPRRHYPILFAPQYLPLLFTALEREGCPANRTSVVIALGDLAFRFPNALEPW
jgi:condensin complex subunit 1